MAGVPHNQNQNQKQQQQQQHQLGLQEAPISMAATLLIRHLPEAIPEDTLSRLFSHYGASSVRPCSSNGRLRNCAFLDFQNEVMAFQAQRQLNGLRFLGKVLKAEKASKPTQDDNNKPQQASHEAQLSKDSMSPAPTSSMVTSTSFSKENKAEQVPKLGSLPAAEPIAPRLGVDYPFPPHLDLQIVLGKPEILIFHIQCCFGS